MQTQSELPEGWANTTLEEVSHVKLGKTPKKSQYRNEGIHRIIKFKDISNHGLEFSGDKDSFVDDNPDVLKSLRTIQVGDVLLTASAHSGDNIGKKTAFVDKLPCDGDDTYFVGELLAVTSNAKIIDEKWPFYFFQSEIGFEEIQRAVFGVHLTSGRAKKIKFSLPPLSEQHRIVLAIEALFARLDAANEQLDRVPEILKIFRQSVLAAACDRRLTEEWRDENEFIDTWKNTTIGDISDLTSGLHFKKSEYSNEGVRLLQITNVSFGIIKWEKTAFLPETYLVNYPGLILKPGDLLMALNRPLLGDNLKVSKLTDRDCPSILYQRVGRFDIYNEKYKDYFYCFLQSPLFIKRLKNDLQGVDQPFINKSKLLKIPIPLPPLPEQHEIVRRVDALFTLADSIEAKVAAARERTEKIRQSILAKAFSGKLVETEAELARRKSRDYEPADMLLERIKAEQEKSDKKGKAAK